MTSLPKELLTLPPQLLEAIREILSADVSLPDDLRKDLASASEAATHLPPRGSTPLDSDGGDEDDPVGRTIPLEVVESLSRWAATPDGTAKLKRGGLDSPRYSLISLLAGTEIYMPKAKRERLLASENPEKPNPYLPMYLSPTPPSIGQELRSMTSQLTTILNVLFSVGGSAAAVYVAAVTGAGWRRESAILLGLLAAIVVGIADGVLIWIYTTRLGEGRKSSKQRAVEINRGSGGIAVEAVPKNDSLQVDLPEPGPTASVARASKAAYSASEDSTQLRRRAPGTRKKTT